MRMTRMWAWLGVLASTGCLSRVEGHCGNNGGDAACGDPAPYCDLCTLARDGCVAEPPGPTCRPAEVDGEGSGTTEAEPTGTTADAECMADSAVDPQCSVDAPYCVAGTCTGCSTQGQGFCAALDPATPLCDAELERCVECTPSAPLCDAETPFCAPDRICRGCWTHDQCPDSACDFESGECLPTTAVAWVDQSTCPDPGTGTEQDPFCEIRSAVLLPVDVLTIWVRSGAVYDERILVGAPRTIAIRGVGERPQLTHTSSVLNASNSARLLVAGIDVIGDDHGVSCTGADVWLEDVRLQPGIGDGIFATKCAVHVDRSQILDRDGYGIELRNGSSLDLRSSIVALNGTTTTPTHAVWAREGSTFRIVYSTLAGNRSTQAGSIACEEGATGELRNSIVTAFGDESIACEGLVASHAVVDTPLSGDELVKVSALSPAWFHDVPEGDFHVRDVDQTPFVDLARWQAGDPYEDFDGQARVVSLEGAGIVGADEP